MINLIGHVINKIAYNDEDQTLSLTVDNDKVFLIKVEGRCCSSGKFIGTSEDYSLDLPQKVIAVEERSESFDYGELYQVYEETLTFENTSKYTIVYDNKSNGYYGSSLESYYNGEHLWEFPK